MKCPVCLKELEYTHKDRYESISEHASNPNGTPSLKKGYQCPDKFCVSYCIDAVWTDDGELFIKAEGFPERFNNLVGYKIIGKASTTGREDAINSWSDRYNENYNWINSNQKEFRFKKIRVVFTPLSEDLRDGKYYKKSWKYLIDVYIGGTKFNSFWSTIKFRLKTFKDNSEHDIISPFNMNRCYNIMEGNDIWTEKKDHIFSSIFVSFWVKTFHWKKVRLIRNLRNSSDKKKQNGI